MNNQDRIYFFSSNTALASLRLEKLLRLLLGHEVNVTNEDDVFLVDNLSINDFTTLIVSLDAMKFDLQADDIKIVNVPTFNQYLKKLALDYRTNGVYYAYEVLLSYINEKKIEIDNLKELFKGVQNDVLLTVKNYLKLNNSLSETSKIMFTHRNTINYRINKFIAITGIDIRSSYNGMFVLLVLSFLDLK